MLKVVDKEAYILDGILHQFPLEGQIDEGSIISSIEKYKQKLQTNASLGYNDQEIQENTQDEVSEQEVIAMKNQDPLEVMINLKHEFEEEILDPNDASFQVLDVAYNKNEKQILCRIHILDSENGMVIRGAIDQFMRCYISGGDIEYAIDRDRSIQHRMVMVNKVVDIKGNWKINYSKK